MRSYLSPIVCMVFFVLSVLFIPKIFAAEPANQASIRFDSNVISQSPGQALIIYETPVVVESEAYFAVTLDSNWQPGTHFSTTATQYVTSTNNLPVGTVALPLTQPTAISVTDRTIYFAISDLTPGVKYAFYITNAAAGFIQNPSLAQNMLHTLATSDSSLQVLSSKIVSSPTVASNTISVQAGVLPQASDLAVELSQISPTSSPIAQNQEIEYEILFSSQLAYPLSAQIEAEWSLGTVQGSLAPTVAVVEYVSGSASTPTGGSAPIIDIANRRIIWNLIVPALASDETMRFSLKTTTAYTASSLIEFSTRASFSSPIQTSYSELTGEYLYSPPATPPSTITPSTTPTAESQPSAAPATQTPGLGAIPSPSPLPRLGSFIKSNQLQAISQSTIILYAETNFPGVLRARFGNDPTRLDRITQSTRVGSSHELNFENLEKDTSYYVLLQFSSGEGLAFRDHSELLLIRTASHEYAGFSLLNITVKHNGFPVKKIASVGSPELLTTDERQLPTVMIPRSTQYEIMLDSNGTFVNGELELQLVDERVLGHSTNTIDAIRAPIGATYGRLLTLFDTSHYGVFRTPDTLSRQQVVIRASDGRGNIQTLPLFTLLIVEPMRVLSAKGGVVPEAELLFSRKNPSTGLFETLDENIWGFANPLRSQSNGDVPILLPSGEYSVEVSAFEFQTAQHAFFISENGGQYPEIILDNGAFSWNGLLKEYQTLMGRISQKLTVFFESIVQSSRISGLLIQSTFLLLLLANISLLSMRLGITIFGLPSYLSAMVSRMFQKKTWKIGRVSDAETKLGIPGAQVSIINLNKHTLIRTLHTNVAGFFYYHLPSSVDAIQLHVRKKGFDSLVGAEFSQESLEGSDPISLMLSKDQTLTNGILRVIGEGILRVLSFGLEAYLLIMLILLYFYTQSTGLTQTWFLWFFFIAACLLMVHERWQLLRARKI